MNNDDSIFYCIINNHEHYYMGFYKSDTNNGYSIPAVSPNISDALKLTFEEEARRIVKALGKLWKVKKVAI